MTAHHNRILPISLALIVGAILAVLVAAGCSNDLPVASQLERTRVLGARVEVASDPGRAEVSPGEAAAVSWIIAGPITPTTLDWAFALCTTGGADWRGSAAAARDRQRHARDGALHDARRGHAGHQAAAAHDRAVCADGTLGFDPTGGLPTCSGPGASGTPVRFTVPVTPDGEVPNHHPVLSNDVLEFRGATWDPATATIAAPGDACDATTGLPVVSATPAGSDAVKQEIRIVSDGDDRETFTPAGKTVPELEELQISNFTTAGKFESSYAAIFATDTRPDADVIVKWEPPSASTVLGGGEVVVFHFVVRDLRGGLDFTSRALCVVAP
jgi:hypothetical protein